MPLAPHLFVAAAYYYLCILLPLARYGAGAPKPRLQPNVAVFTALLLDRRKCRDVTRFSPSELKQLASDLLITDPDEIKHNWRFSPMHRLLMALIMLSNHPPMKY